MRILQLLFVPLFVVAGALATTTAAAAHEHHRTHQRTDCDCERMHHRHHHRHQHRDAMWMGERHMHDMHAMSGDDHRGHWERRVFITRLPDGERARFHRMHPGRHGDVFFYRHADGCGMEREHHMMWRHRAWDERGERDGGPHRMFMQREHHRSYGYDGEEREQGAFDPYRDDWRDRDVAAHPDADDDDHDADSDSDLDEADDRGDMDRPGVPDPDSDDR